MPNIKTFILFQNVWLLSVNNYFMIHKFYHLSRFCQMSPLFSLCVLFLSCSAASRNHDFTLCNTLAQWSGVIFNTFQIHQHSRILDLFTPVCHAFNLCFKRKLPRSRPTFKLALILLLAGYVSLNPRTCDQAQHSPGHH